jgi:hypothetical protein
MRTASVVLAAVAAVVFATGRAADRTPAYITAAVADLARPAADRERDATRKPDECVAFAGLKPGDRIADIFPGRGYYSRIFSNVVGPKGHEFFSTRGGAQPIEIIGAVQLNFTYSVQPVLETVEDTARQFLTFMRTHYEAHYADSKIPEEYRDGPLFLVGGYSRADHLPSLYRVNVQKNAITPMYAAGNFGLAWEGQSDAVERLIRGYDSDLRSAFERQITAGIETLRKAIGEAAAAMLQQVLDHAGIAMADGINTELPAGSPFTLPWDGYRCNIAYSHLPLQDAVDLVSFLVGAKFATGVPTGTHSHWSDHQGERISNAR